MTSGTSTITLYDTYSRQKQALVPLDPSNVRMYVCGPTVYDYAHIGNARPVIVFDVLYRLLRHTYGADHVRYVRNITDVDDKINARAARDYPDLPLNEAIRKVTEKTHDQYQKDVTALGCLPPDAQPRATEFITHMVEMSKTLIDKKHAYVAEGHVLFDVKSWQREGETAYGKLSRRSLDDMIAGARVEVAPYKRDPMDFVLWKPSSDAEPGWESPWGRGRPGWHIECSAMSKAELGATFDIHGGGIDLSFPHHENELAQSCCANDTDKMAQIWMHNGFLQVEGKKMSKSDGNFITIHELLETDKFGGHKWPGEVLRLAMLMTHYRDPIDFSIKRLEEAESKLNSWRRVASTGTKATPEPAFVEALSDDLNFHRASVVLDAVARKAKGGSAEAAHCLAASLEFMGFSAQAPQLDEAEDDDGTQEAVAARLEALNAKDFARADEIRAELLEQGIQLMDYKDAETGERRTKWEGKR